MGQSGFCRGVQEDQGMHVGKYEVFRLRWSTSIQERNGTHTLASYYCGTISKKLRSGLLAPLRTERSDATRATRGSWPYYERSRSDATNGTEQVGHRLRTEQETTINSSSPLEHQDPQGDGTIPPHGAPFIRGSPLLRLYGLLSSSLASKQREGVLHGGHGLH